MLASRSKHLQGNELRYFLLSHNGSVYQQSACGDLGTQVQLACDALFWWMIFRNQLGFDQALHNSVTPKHPDVDLPAPLDTAGRSVVWAGTR